MRSRIAGLLNKILYALKYGKSVCFEGIPSFITRKQFYVQSGKIKVGKNFSVKQGAYLAAVNGGEIVIGNNVSIGRNCILVCHKKIFIGDHCAIAPNVVVYDHDHNFGGGGLVPGFKTAPIVIEKNCWVGAGVTILRGTHIGEGCVVGAGAVVKGIIPPHSLVTADRSLKITPIEDR